MTRHFQHPNGSVETTPPSRKDTFEAYMRASRGIEYGYKSDHKTFCQTNRLAYKADTDQDMYKYKYEEIET